MELNRKEIEIILKLRDEASQKIKSFNAATKEFKKATQDSLSPILNLRRAWMYTGIAVTATIGTFLKAAQEIAKLREEQTKLDKTSIKLGITSEELSKKLYGFNIGTSSARIGSDQAAIGLQQLNRIKLYLQTKAAEGVGQSAIAARQNELMAKERISNPDQFKTRDPLGGKWEFPWSKETEAVRNKTWNEAKKQLEEESNTYKENEAIKAGIVGEVENKIQQLTLSSYEYKKYLLNQEVKDYLISGVSKEDANKLYAEAYKRLEEEKTQEVIKQQATRLKTEGNTIAAMRLEQQAAADAYIRLWGPDSEATKAFIAGQQAQMREAKLSFYGIESETIIWNSTFKSYISDANNFFGNVLYSGIKNKFSDLTEVAASFGDAILQTFTQMLAKLAILKAAAFFGIALLHEGGMIGQPGGRIRPIYAHAGLAPDEIPIIAQTGEAVLSRRGVSALGGSNSIRELNSGHGSGKQVINDHSTNSYSPVVILQQSVNDADIERRIINALNRNRPVRYSIRSRT